MVELVVELVQRLALAEARVLGDQLAVALPEGRAEAGAPRHAPLGLVVAVVGGRVEDARLALDRRHVAAPQVAVQHRRLHLDALEERAQLVRVHEHLGPQLLERRVARRAHLVPDPLLAEEVDPVLAPRVRLGRAAARVCHVEAELALLRLLRRRRCEVHLGHPPAEDLLVGAAAERQEVHDDVRAGAALAVAKVQHLRDFDRVGGVHRPQAERLAVEHLLAVLARGLDEELPIRRRDPAERGPAAAAQPGALADLPVVLFNPLLRISLRPRRHPHALVRHAHS